MNPAQKSFELQTQVRQNAEIYRNQLNDLYSWEKEIKDKELELQRTPAAKQLDDDVSMLDLPPVRSHVADQTSANAQQQKKGDTAAMPSKGAHTTATTPTEKLDLPTNPLAQKHKEANEWKERGNGHVKLAEYDKAVEAYSHAVKTFGGDAVYYTNRALCYLKLERYNECIDDCELAIEIDKSNVKAYYRRMQANESLGNDMDALKDCTSVLTIEPKNIEAKKSLERINARLRSNARSATGPNFSSERSDLVDILPIYKPPYKRSNKALRRVPIVDVVGPKDTKDQQNANLKISDEDIDKLFNSYCGQIEEVKKNPFKELKINSKNSAENEAHQFEVKEKKTKAITELKTQPIREENIKQNLNFIDSNKLITESKPIIENQGVTKMAPVQKNNVQKSIRSLPPPPTSTTQFYSNWKELNGAQKYLYLQSIELSQVCKILGAGFDSDTLTDIIQMLHDYYVPNKVSTTAAILLEISKNQQIKILSLLMSSEEKKVLCDIINSFKDLPEISPIVTSQIYKNFNLN